MKYFYKLLLWKTNLEYEDLTMYLVEPIYREPKLNEELATGEVVLERVPIETKYLFPPKTKIRIEKYIKEDFSDKPKTYDYVVKHDDIEEFVSNPEICTHRLNLINPLVVAQGIHIDNIALTYELQDATLKYRTTQIEADYTNTLHQNVGYSQPVHKSSFLKVQDDATGGAGYVVGSTRYEGVFENSYKYEWDRNTFSSLNNILKKYNAADINTISFEIPKLFCFGSYDNANWSKLFEMNVKATVYRYDVLNGIINKNTKVEVVSKVSGPTSLTSVSDSVMYCDGTNAYLRTLSGGEYYTENLEKMYSTSGVLASASQNYSNRTIEFTTTDLSDGEIENGKGYFYEIEIKANPITPSAMMQYIGYSVVSMSVIDTSIGLYFLNSYATHINNSPQVVDSLSVNVINSFNATDMYSDTISQPFILKAKKYSCWELLRKSFLTTDTQLIDNEVSGLDDIEYMFTIDPNWENRLKTKIIYETVLENKNLAELFNQIGYYLHAQPMLKFAEDGTDRFVLTFIQLGGNIRKEDASQKITIFNSLNLSNYFTQYDSYVTNIFSPQNEVEEWLVCTTEDSSSLVSNNTALLKTKYGISEIIEFDIIYKGESKSAIEHIFEKSIYQILTSDYRVSPGLGDSVYFTLGNNVIDGLNYIPPSQNNDLPMSMKRIVNKLFENASLTSLKFNDLQFHIKYRTQDSMRVSQVRPDIENFMKNSKYEKYPHHEQFFGQQDKIIDSERFSLNLFGKLVRVGNNIYQCQEMVSVGQEKEPGELYEIDGEPYYVTACENEEYSEVILQKVTYSKNYNQLSNIVTIPSEPRFYEVSERSTVRREIRLFDFFKISTQENGNKLGPRYLSDWKNNISKMLFNQDPVNNPLQHPNYAWTRFEADKKRNHKGSFGQLIEIDNLFPSSELDRRDENNIVPIAAGNHSDCIVPLLHFPQKDGIVYEWDMEDNFKAGDALDTEISGNSADDAYYAKQSVRYCDIMGRADLFRFKLFNKKDWSHSDSQKLPKGGYYENVNGELQYISFEPTESVFSKTPEKYLIALEKDCREALSFNYQISLLYRNDDNKGDFCTYSNLFGEKDNSLQCCLLNKEVSMFDENTNTIPADILLDKVNFEIVFDDEHEQIIIQFNTNSNINYAEVKSIVFYEEDSEGNRVSYIAKNFKNGLDDKVPNLYIYPVFND